jgi:hypothetical protein
MVLQVTSNKSQNPDRKSKSIKKSTAKTKKVKEKSVYLFKFSLVVFTEDDFYLLPLHLLWTMDR